MHKAISVIIPVYNGEKYLSRCLESVLSQQRIPVESLEILVIDDGSTDGSGAIIKRFADQHPCTITHLDQPNQGVAETRNRGIAASTGDYITFIDQDDYIDQDFLTTLFDVAERTHADVVISGLRRPDSRGNTVYSFSPNRDAFDKYILVSAWGKLHRRSFLVDNDITFFYGKLGEDIPFTIREYLQTVRIAHTQYIGYNWYFNELSVSNTSQRGLQSGFESLLIDLLAALKREYDVRTVPVDESLFSYFLLYTVIGYLGVSGRSANTQAFLTVFRQAFDWLEANTEHLYRNPRIVFPPRGVATKARIGISTMLFFRKTRLVPLFAKIYCRS